MVAGNVNEAVLSLSIAYERDPQNIAAGKLLAQLWQTTQPSLSDRIFSDLFHRHSTHRREIAELWCGALLRRGNFPQICRLATEVIVDSETASMSWSVTLLEASRLDGHSTWRKLDPEAKRRLHRHIQSLMRIELQAEELWNQDRAKFSRSFPTPSPITSLVTYQIASFLLAKGQAAEALAFLDRTDASLDIRTRTSLRLDAFAVLGWTTLRQQEIDSVLSMSPARQGMETIASHLIRYPDVALSEQLFRKSDSSVLPQDSNETLALTATLYCLAGVVKNVDRMAQLRKLIETAAGGSYQSLNLLDDYFLGRAADQRLGSYLPFLPHVPNEVAWALFRRETLTPRNKLGGNPLRSP